MKTIKDNTLEFTSVITEIETFLEPVFNAMLNEEKREMQRKADMKWIK